MSFESNEHTRMHTCTHIHAYTIKTAESFMLYTARLVSFSLLTLSALGWNFQQMTYKPAHHKTYNKTCVTSNDSDQTVHPPSMARILVHPSLDSLEAVEGTCNQWRLIRLHGCAGWSESLLIAQALLLVLSCAGSYWNIFLIFPIKQVLKFHANYLLLRLGQFAWNVISYMYFLGKIRKI